MGSLRFRVCTMVLLLGACSFLWGCAETTAEIRPQAVEAKHAEEEELLGLIPAEATLVLSVDLASLRKSPWTRAAFEEASRNAAKDSGFEGVFVERTDSFLFAMLPALGENVSLVVARGRFEADSVPKFFPNSAASPTRGSYRGTELYESGEQALALLGRRLLVAGPGVAVRSALDCGQGQARSLDGSGWMEKLKTDSSPGAESEASKEVASLYVELTDTARMQLAEEIGEGGTLEYAAVRVSLGESMVLRGFGRTRNDQQARDLSARLAQHLQDAERRPIVAAFGFGKVLAGARFASSGASMSMTMRVSSTEREFIASRMAAVSRTIAQMRADRKQQEKAHP